MKKINTSWGKDAHWYNDVVTEEDSYQKKVILPNLLRMMQLKAGERILDVGCGTGFFSGEFFQQGGDVTGIDIGKELLEIAKRNFPQIKFLFASADNMPDLKAEFFDKAVIVLALQNMENPQKVFSEIKRVLKKEGKIYLVLNHPAFRIPGDSSWGWDQGKKQQYRRVDTYLSEKKVKIQMHPGENPEIFTWSFHRPLQYFFKVFNKNKIVVTRVEEWISHRETKEGPRKEGENRARKEIPLFMAFELKNE